MTVLGSVEFLARMCFTALVIIVFTRHTQGRLRDERKHTSKVVTFKEPERMKREEEKNFATQLVSYIMVRYRPWIKGKHVGR